MDDAAKSSAVSDVNNSNGNVNTFLKIKFYSTSEFVFQKVLLVNETLLTTGLPVPKK